MPSSRAKSLGIELSSLVDTIDNYEPMMVVVLGDREEALAAATACVYSQVICVHLCGGDSTADGNSQTTQLETLYQRWQTSIFQQQKKVKTVLLIWEKTPGGSLIMVQQAWTHW